MEHKATLSERVNEAIFVDEIGLRYSRYNDVVLKTSFLPIFERRADLLVPIGVEGLAAPFIKGDQIKTEDFFKSIPKEDALFIETVLARLHLENFRNLYSPELSLYLNYDPSVEDLEFETLAVLGQGLQQTEIGALPSSMVVEITGARSMGDGYLKSVQERLRTMGIGLAIDDFGARHATADRVALLRPDVVKIDGDWFREVIKRDETVRLFAPTVESFRALGAHVLVESVETPDELAAALEAGVDYIQGHVLEPAALAGSVYPYESSSIAEMLSRAGASEEVVARFAVRR
ncbi:EAL domain-containing protein [Limoniibacter endophyticus]|uniref:Diguanylate phosphodiesterase n=1 Tax=Limoniibacter endophyticus TaxID=1565040 RepID=A0A8J3DM11_9HYPH|nr:EAL domain-containing protein [Limoniibacter endophyticus]GHC65902.1 diguanylate phosphodiesterase [Limoniibacter endophyticus]